MTDSSAAKPGFYGWTNVFLLFIIYMSAFGMVYYGYSVIFPLMIKTLDWNRGTASIAATVMALLMGFLMPLVAISIQRFGPKKTLTFGFSLLLLGLLIIATFMNEIWQWTVLYGVVVAAGFAFGGPITIQTAVLYWFNVKRATAMGIVMTSAAIGGFIAGPFYNWLIGFTGNWKSGWLCAAGFVFVGLVCTLFLVDKPEDIGQYADGLSPEELAKMTQANEGKTAKIHKTTDLWTVKEALKTKTIWFFAVMVVGHLMALTFIATHGILSFMDRGFGDMAPWIFSAVLLGSATIRIPMGLLGDKIEPLKIVIVSFAIMFVMLLIIWQLQNVYIVVPAAFIFGSCYGTQLILFPTLMGNYFGPEAFANINGVLAPMFTLFGAVVPVGAGYICEASGNYNPVYISLLCILACSFVSASLMRPPLKKA